jgi:ubiquitin-protein ligase E3 C
MFNQQELQVLLGGVNTPIDIDDLRRNTNYGGLYDAEQPTIQAFWKVRPRARSPVLSHHRLFFLRS